MLNGNKRKVSKKAIICGCALLLAVLVSIGVTLAYIIASDGPLKNEFTPSVVTTSVNETLEGRTKTKVSIKNTGDTEAYIRAAVIFNWQDSAGNILGKTPQEGVDYKISWNVSTDYNKAEVWVKGADGYYYYTSPVAAQHSTKNLINSCEETSPVTISNSATSTSTIYYLTVEIVCSGIQSTPYDAVSSSWNSGVQGVIESGNTVILDVKH